ncbi:hypothetical protein ACLKA7_004293 [Drosophila subpalustris]
MILKIIGFILIINTHLKHSDAVQIAELNVTNVFLSINSQLTELRAQLDRQSKFADQHNFRSYELACDATTHGGGWTVILSRLDGSVDFYRSWNIYKKGFGDLDGEFFLGLDKIHALTAEFSQEMLVVFEDFEGTKTFEVYEKFAIGDEDEQYALRTLGTANGTAGDSLRRQHGMRFSTLDRDNDLHEKNCAVLFTGAWWYKDCHDCNLAGRYKDNAFGKGINWHTFRGKEYSLKRAVMMIRPRK